jgi:hypothetical protein
MNESNHSEDVEIGGRMVLKWILKKGGGRVSTGILWLVIGHFYEVFTILNLHAVFKLIKPFIMYDTLKFSKLFGCFYKKWSDFEDRIVRKDIG